LFIFYFFTFPRQNGPTTLPCLHYPPPWYNPPVISWFHLPCFTSHFHRFSLWICLGTAFLPTDTYQDPEDDQYHHGNTKDSIYHHDNITFNRHGNDVYEGPAEDDDFAVTPLKTETVPMTTPGTGAGMDVPMTTPLIMMSLTSRHSGMVVPVASDLVDKYNSVWPNAERQSQQARWTHFPFLNWGQLD